MKSLVHPLFTNQNITVVDTLGASVFPQRIRDELGALQVTLNQDPGAPPVGFLTLEGRLRPDLPFRAMLNVDLADAELNAGSFTKVITGIDILPEMRIATRTNGGYTVVGGTTATVLLME